jgi:uroporphyrinogen III methyltransferase / synthase
MAHENRPDPSAHEPVGAESAGAPRRPRVVVTRAEEQAAPLADRLEALGCEVVLCPLIRIEPLGDGPVDVGAYDWVVVTSPNGAGELARRLMSPPRRLAAVGPATAQALRAHGLEPDLVPEVSSQDGLLAELPRPAGRVLVAAAEGARRLLVNELGADFLPLYRTVELQPEQTPDGDLVVLASPSAARALAGTSARLPVVAIGPHTAEAAEALGFEIIAVAEAHDLDGLVAAVERVL